MLCRSTNIHQHLSSSHNHIGTLHNHTMCQSSLVETAMVLLEGGVGMIMWSTPTPWFVVRYSNKLWSLPVCDSMCSDTSGLDNICTIGSNASWRISIFSTIPARFSINTIVQNNYHIDINNSNFWLANIGIVVRKSFNLNKTLHSQLFHALIFSCNVKNIL